MCANYTEPTFTACEEEWGAIGAANMAYCTLDADGKILDCPEPWDDPPTTFCVDCSSESVYFGSMCAADGDTTTGGDAGGAATTDGYITDCITNSLNYATREGMCVAHQWIINDTFNGVPVEDMHRCIMCGE